MISDGRYSYHLQDIAALKAKPQPLHPADQMMLDSMKKYVKEYELANPDKVKTAEDKE